MIMVKRETNKKASGGATGRAKPLTAKVSVTRSGRRRYGEGGKIK